MGNLPHRYQALLQTRWLCLFRSMINLMDRQKCTVMGITNILLCICRLIKAVYNISLTLVINEYCETSAFFASALATYSHLIVVIWCCERFDPFNYRRSPAPSCYYNTYSLTIVSQLKTWITHLLACKNAWLKYLHRMFYNNKHVLKYMYFCRTLSGYVKNSLFKSHF